VNDQKFACESCIKGHRSSSCQHTDRPLFEIKKKGRPVSQCERCRELRKTKRMHNKCTCACGSSAESQQPQVATPSSSKSRRFKPIAPALPNGLKSLLPELTESTPMAGPSSNDSSSSSCGCGAPGCLCLKAAIHPYSADTLIHPDRRPQNGLAALAAAADIYSRHEHLSAGNEASPSLVAFAVGDSALRHGKQRCATLATGEQPKHLPGRLAPEQCSLQRKRRRSSSNEATSSLHVHSHTEESLELPPIRYPGTPDGRSGGSPVVPVFPPIPPLCEITSLAAPGCCCGVECTCPGCVQHRGRGHASKDFHDCADGCGTCVDNENGVALPSPRSGSFPSHKSGSSAQPNFIDAFFARAAALPLPPATRTAGLDAMNVTIYPTALFRGDAKEREERGAAFGLVSLPPLECGCAGGCGCPAGRCGCGEGCGGCC